MECTLTLGRLLMRNSRLPSGIENSRSSMNPHSYSSEWTLQASTLTASGTSVVWTQSPIRNRWPFIDGNSIVRGWCRLLNFNIRLWTLYLGRWSRSGRIIADVDEVVQHASQTVDPPPPRLVFGNDDLLPAPDLTFPIPKCQSELGPLRHVPPIAHHAVQQVVLHRQLVHLSDGDFVVSEECPREISFS